VQIIKENLIILLTVFILFLIWNYAVMNTIPLTIVKNEQFLWFHGIIFFPILAISLIVFQKNIRQHSWFKVIIFSIIGGHFISMLSLTFAGVLLPFGGEKFHNGLKNFGIFNLILTKLIGSLICMGWIFTPIGTSIIKIRKRVF
jgi:hypothetical protein